MLLIHAVRRRLYLAMYSHAAGKIGMALGRYLRMVSNIIGQPVEGAYSLMTCMDEVIEVITPFRGSWEMSTQSTSLGSSASMSVSAMPGGLPRDIAIVRSSV